MRYVKPCPPAACTEDAPGSVDGLAELGRLIEDLTRAKSTTEAVEWTSFLKAMGEEETEVPEAEERE